MKAAPALYWDSSAVLAFLLAEPHQPEAERCLRRPAVRHLVSSLGWTEVHATLARVGREQRGAEIAETLAALAHSPWGHIDAVPHWELIALLAQRWPLRGADLWHLALAKSLSQQLPGLMMLTFDVALAAAAAGEGLSATP